MSDDNFFNESYSDVLRYLGNKMKSSERSVFEKELEEDAFLRDAVEGLSNLNFDGIEHDIDSFSFIRPKKMQWQRAAIILFIIAIVTVFVFVLLRKDEKNKNNDIEKEVTKTPSISKIEQVNVGDSLTSDSTDIIFADSLETELDDTTQVASIKGDTTSRISKDIERNAEEVKQKKNVEENTKPQIPEEKNEVEAPSVETAIVEEPQDSDFIVGVTEEVTGEKEQPENKTSIRSNQIKEELNKEESDSTTNKKNINIEDTNVKIEQNQETETEDNVLVESYKEQMEPRPGVNADPKPLGGRSLFNEYIDGNLRYPLTGKGRQVVKVEFTITPTGTLNDFKVLRSPDNESFQKEAIRILTEGPKWSPAIEDGIPVKHRESVRIVFRP